MMSDECRPYRVRLNARSYTVTLFLLAAALAGGPLARAAGVSFRTDVMAVLSKAGCNAGACHGNANGKAGFKLSLRGEDPESDFKTLTRDMFARRTNPHPEGEGVLPPAQLAGRAGSQR